MDSEIIGLKNMKSKKTASFVMFESLAALALCSSAVVFFADIQISQARLIKNAEKKVILNRTNLEKRYFND
ncbi:hypothetical protein Q757_06190 [Oenococcus alcoholitolerans]|uniref:Type II secretion system protein n=1 Tax=Oenococcus alcoholitolerans TaxID=931074 RepID=A0ABR4XQ61_9LACO|nr:hypothetical protein Q757_06190 [Oenococcus alcoholitolerans]